MILNVDFSLKISNYKEHKEMESVRDPPDRPPRYGMQIN